MVDWYRYNIWQRNLTRIPVVSTLPHIPFGITRRTIEAEVYTVTKWTDEWEK
jgi:hypothetical protein